MSNIIDKIEREQMRTDIPNFSPGDTVVVQVRVIEASRERLQAFEGVVIAKRNRGLNSSFIVRKISYGEGVERTFQTHSRMIHSVTVKKPVMCAVQNYIIYVIVPVNLHVFRKIDEERCSITIAAKASEE